MSALFSLDCCYAASPHCHHQCWECKEIFDFVTPSELKKNNDRESRPSRKEQIETNAEESFFLERTAEENSSK
jgi:hypothetical protein